MRILYSFPQSSIGPATRVVLNGKPPTETDDVIVERFDGDRWVTVERYNSLSNDYAYTAARDRASRLNAPQI